MNQSSKKIALNALFTGFVGAALGYYVLGEDQNVTYFNMDVPAPVAIGLATAVGSVASDLGSEYVIKRLGMTNQFINSSTALTQSAVCGGATALTLWAGGLPANINSMMTAGLVGTGAKFGGDYANDKLFSPVNGIIGPIF